MLILNFLLSAYVAGTVFASAGVSGQLSTTDLLAEIPQCALGCLVSNLSKSKCDLANLTCICTNVPLQASLSTCIQGACNFTAQEKVSVINGELCAGVPIQYRGWEVIIVGIVLGIITVVIVVLRCYSRHLIAKSFWWDDWTIIVAAVFFIATIFTAVFNCSFGYGKHYWNIGPSRVRPLSKLFWAGELFYCTTLAFTRISILLFYLRVFQATWFRRLAIAIIIFAAAFALTSNFVIIFQCKPISAIWDFTIPRSNCINLNAFAFSNAGIGIVQDLTILFIPIPQLLQLQMNLTKKLNLMLMFSLGSLACVTSIIRLKFIVAFGDTKDPTWDNITPSAWSMIEIAVAMICACLPSIRALLSRLIPAIFGSTLSSTTDSSWDPSRKKVTTQSTLKFKEYNAKNLGNSIVTGSDESNWKDRSVLHATSVTTAKSPSSWSEDVRNTSSSLSDSGEVPDTAHGNAKRSDEIMFLHVGEQAMPMSKLKRHHITTRADTSAIEG